MTTENLKRPKKYRENFNKLNYAVTNSRSLIPKIDSVVNYFEEHSLSFMIVTETWLKRNTETDEILQELQNGAHLNLIRKDRTSRRGGGVAILYDNREAKLSKYQIPGIGASHEIVCAMGNINGMTKSLSSLASTCRRSKQEESLLK